MIYFSVWSRSTYSNVPSRVWGGERGEGLTETSTISGQTTEGTPWKVVAADAKTGLGQLEDGSVNSLYAVITLPSLLLAA